MVSIRDTCEDCLGETGTLRLNRDLFGYIYGKIDRDLKVREHIERIRGESINICIFLVGHEPGFAGTFTAAQSIRVQHAIDVTREIYSQVDLGVRVDLVPLVALQPSEHRALPRPQLEVVSAQRDRMGHCLLTDRGNEFIDPGRERRATPLLGGRRSWDRLGQLVHRFGERCQHAVPKEIDTVEILPSAQG